MEQNFLIEEMKKNHINEVIELWKETEGIHLHENGEDNADGISMFIDRNKGLSFVAKNNKDEIIGTILCGNDGRRGYIHHLAVKKNNRNNGIAKELVNRALQNLQYAGIKKAALFVLKDNNDAQSFYKHIGWNQEEIINIYSKIL